MSIRFSLLDLTVPEPNDPCAWNDPRRELYPNHAEFWAEEVPEHVQFEREALELRRLRQRALVRSLFGLGWLPAVISFGRRPRWPASILENPMETQKRPDASGRC